MPPKSITFEHSDGAELESYMVGSIAVHRTQETSGEMRLIMPDNALILFESSVTLDKKVDGVSHGRQHYSAGMVGLRPAGSELSIWGASNPFTATMIRIPRSALISVSTEPIDFTGLIAGQCIIPKHRIFGVIHAVKAIALSSARPSVLVDALTTALVAEFIYAVMSDKDAVDEIASTGLSKERRNQAIEFIETNLHHPILLSQIAGAASLSQFHFSRAFKASVGLSPVKYVLARRIKKARRMLLSTDVPIVGVALACGFSSQSHFSTAFKAATGRTPADFRRGKYPISA